MFYKNRKPNFNLNPVSKLEGLSSEKGYEQIRNVLKNRIKNELGGKKRVIVIIDTYHGVNQEELFNNLVDRLGADLIINSDDAKYPEEIIFERFKKFINPSDRTYGVFSVCEVSEFFNDKVIDKIRNQIENTNGIIVIYGVAASVIDRGDILVYGNITQQEIINRLARGLDNWGAGNYKEEILKKQKRGQFLEWRVLDRHKRSLQRIMDYMIDFNIQMEPVMISGDDYRKAITMMTKKPFEPVPIFTKAIWGGQWIQKVIGANLDDENVGWGITGILEFQSFKMQCGSNTIEIPCNDLIYYKPREILGNKIFYFWGYRNPVHVNFLDTWGGGNLSLQVHPTTDYAFEVFNSSYGHHESYYIFDATDHSSVFLGLKEGAKVSEMVEDLEKAQETAQFDASKYVNQISVKKHDHVFIPGGTVHCSGEGTVVLEIDEFCFATFKLWDWGRIDFDGKPRPINIDHGQYNIQENFQGQWVYDNLISKQKEVDRGKDWRKDDSSTMSYEPMAVFRYWFTGPIELETNDAIMLHVLVEGEEAVIESVDNSFEPYVFHYAEAVFIPANVGKYVIKPVGGESKEEMAVLQIYYPM